MIFNARLTNSTAAVTVRAPTTKILFRHSLLDYDKLDPGVPHGQFSWDDTFGPGFPKETTGHLLS